MSLDSDGQQAAVDVQFISRLKGLRREERDRLRSYLLALIEEGGVPPRIGRGFSWSRIARDSGVPEASLRRVREELHRRWLASWSGSTTAHVGETATACGGRPSIERLICEVAWADPGGSVRRSTCTSAAMGTRFTVCARPWRGPG